MNTFQEHADLEDAEMLDAQRVFEDTNVSNALLGKVVFTTAMPTNTVSDYEANWEEQTEA